jgi:hypothetical protein
VANEPVTNENPEVGAEGAENPVATTVTNETKPQPKPVVAGDWIPEALRGNKSLGKFKTAGDLAQSYVNLERSLGSRVEIPGENATPEQRSAFYAKLGVPDTHDGYEAPSAPEGVELDNEYFGAFRTKAKELNLTKAQAKGLADWVVAREVAKYSEFSANSEKSRKASMEKLRNGWGAAADQNVGLVQRLIDEYGDEETISDLNETGAGNRAGILRMFAKIARTQVDNDVMAAADIGTSQKAAQTDLDNTLAAAKADKKHPYRNESHPGHKAEVARVRRLYEIAYPDLEFRPDGM